MTSDGQDRDGQLRLSMTLPGSASLGAFQAGAVAAVSVAVGVLRERGRPVVVDAIGGASAGSFVALLFAHCHVTGKDVPRMLRRAWVDDVDVTLLGRNGGTAPLGFGELETRLRDLLDHDDHPPAEHPPAEHPLVLQIGLTSLLGLNTAIGAGSQEALTLTYADWAEYELSPGAGLEAIFEPPDGCLFDAVLASATHPGAFAPRLVDRSGQRRAYEAKGIVNFPESGRLWYTDGGLVESKPVGRILAAARRRSDGDVGGRLHLVVDPRSSDPSGNEEWADPDDPKTWVDGLRRSLSILPTQALHDDLRRVAGVNDRLEALERVMSEVAGRLADPDRDLDPVRAAVAELAGLDDKVPIELEMISPLLLADEEHGVADLLAGDFIGAFGGFLNRSVRQSDYRLGWDCVAEWIPGGLRRQNVPDAVVEAAAAAVGDHEGIRDLDRVVGRDGPDLLTTKDRWQLARVAMTAGASLVGEALPRPSLGRLVDRLRRRRPE